MNVHYNLMQPLALAHISVQRLGWRTSDLQEKTSSSRVSPGAPQHGLEPPIMGQRATGGENLSTFIIMFLLLLICFILNSGGLSITPQSAA